MPALLSINSYHYRRGGSDVVYLDHAALMESQGWENAFFSMRHPKNLETPWSRYFIDELEFGQAYSLRQKLTMAAKAVYSFEAQRKLRMLLADFRPDVAHLHCIYHHHSPSILPVLSDAGIPVVMTAHDLKIACPAYKMLNRTGVCERCKEGSVLNVIRHRCVRDSLSASAIVAVESGLQRAMKAYLKHLTRVVAPSRFFLEKFVEWGWPRERFVYIPNYVDAVKFEPCFEPGDYFLYFGRLAPEKGVATLMRAAKSAGVRLKIAGTGPIEAELHALQAELQGEIEFLGFRSGVDLHALIRGARAVVLPSEWYENAPMSVLESFAFGKPVIGARIGGIPEMIEDGENGWRFESGDAAALAEVLSRVQGTSASDLARAGRAARDGVETRFNWAGYTAAMLALYAGLGVKI
ncbi:MAG: glycosyl transferase [Candidatus Dactylopiibacterium carminicum]|uniref:Glycosyl transferase n=1 Tax=Candidatus Dactylopiibacterium carminicum TaxID=857335 RepID=A0A272EP90_9RHOO|nr:glycosyltransferase [Candidatus Dactylopiibacterium carminicum]KAF7598268.1 glycosyl transferase [Candidatus Dactylopiibacterium carminicum]PAS91933.1 MAG: glycosyl transferase [Candidatus Dactylopiibacterium carminicum]PAS95005.1 MAG: glycosyl transferase [Candidatus Dactylopiibacterium carminicum]PAS97151.1 MAG: glycosyl transferase [Candidatus Dactylopiibacterium carminicum]